MSHQIPESAPDHQINTERFRSLSQVFAQEDFDIHELRAIIDVEDILNPDGRYSGLALPEALEGIRKERAELSFKLIDAHRALATAGAVRVATICQCFNHYAALTGNVAAVERDLIQQDQDVAIMATFSDSQLKFAKTYAEDQPTRLASYGAKVDEQFRALRDFRAEGVASIENIIALKAGVTKDGAVDRPALAALAQSTAEVMQLNFALASVVDDLVKTQLRGIYYWREFLKEECYGTTAVNAHKGEMAYERELGNVYIQRRKILSTRGAQLGRLAEMMLGN